MDSFVGEVRLFPYNFIPRNWVECKGQIWNISENTALFSLLGTTYGGDGKTTFALPNLQGRVAIGPDKDQSLSIGAVGGEASHTLTVNEMPQHNHTVAASTRSGTSNSPVNNVWATYSSNISVYGNSSTTNMNENSIAKTGQNQSHNNMQPYLVLRYCICVAGIYPPRN